MCQDFYSGNTTIPGYSTKLKLGFAVANEPLYDPRQLKCILEKLNFIIKKVGMCNFFGSKFFFSKMPFYLL